MTYILDSQSVYYKNDKITQLIGNVNKSETVRLDENTVVDISYIFDIELGRYIEQSRIERTDVVIQPVDEIALLKAKNVESEQVLADLILTLVERGVL